MHPTDQPARLGVKLAVVQTLTLAAVVWLGTLIAAREGVAAAQTEVFDALMFWQPLGFGISVPLPGVRLLLLTLFCTLVLDRRAWSLRRGHRAVTLLHCGVALLLASGLWSVLRGHDGVVRLRPGETSRSMLGPGGMLPLPFALHFVTFGRTLHPRSQTLQELWAEVEVRVADADPPQSARITLNQPLRYAGVSVHIDDPRQLGNTDRYGEATFRVLRDPGAPLRHLALALLLIGMLAQFVGKLALARQRWVSAG